MPRRLAALLPIIAALALADSASAHATLTPPTVLARTSQVFTLAVPTEKEGVTTTQIELTPPAGFGIDSFAAAPGWTRKTDQSGSGEDVEIRKVTWSGGKVPTGEAALLQFVGDVGDAKTYDFKVRQTYSDGSVVEWTGAAGSDTPAPQVEAKTSLGGGGSSTLATVAFVIATLAFVGAAIALLLKAGEGRELA
ncbi:DUF1775 domain-containing protein [Solirubrobacter soli]|uniref:DUF1775 domain-containing protein n=1 Tax=Solirubrobacter soli TaxID=363832 RepID=UPI0003FB0D12|nr:DUF1775 domain-containing protein [Solirubrobacter soli]